MPSFVTATVTEVLSERAGLQRIATDHGRAYVLTQVTPSVAAGDRVVLNTTAVELGLGTGGWHVVHWNLGVGAWSVPGPGHVMKLRYTSLQVDTGAAEEHAADAPIALEGVPVVVCGVHSQVATAAVAACHTRPGTRVVYVMTDGAALPLALSDLAADLRRLGVLAATVTAGQAFGGDVEAVSVPSALTLARHRLGADIVIVGMGPGVVGTGAPLGTTAVEVAAILDATAALGGRPIAVVRASQADVRPRHRGVSHHTTTALALVRSTVEVALPAGRPEVRAAPGDRHVAVEVAVPDVAALFAGLGLSVTTMRRTVAEDRLYFECAAAGGVLAATVLP